MLVHLRYHFPVLRAFLCFLALALALASVLQYRSLQATQRETALWLDGLGITREAALDREPDPERVRLRAVRSAFAAELDPARRAGLDPETAARESAARLAETAERAGEVLAARPASWEAALVQGGATYLGWSQVRDPRLLQRYRRWEAPLEAALRLAPGKREPVRFLAAAYLEIWPALSPRKKAIAQGMLAEVFRDPEDLKRLIGPWLDVAGSPQEAFQAVPPEARAWERVERALVERGDWRGFAAARARRNMVLLAELRRDLAEADRLRRAGNLLPARVLYLSVAERARPEARYLEVLEAALTRCPPGPVNRETAELLAPHLDRALDRCLLAGCELNPKALKRLSRFVRDAAPEQEALAALFSGDLPAASGLERRSGALWDEDWAPYLIAKARMLASRGRTEEAGETLSLVHRSWQDRPVYWQAQRELALALGDAGKAGKAEERLAALSRTSWPATAWTWRRDRPRLEMLAAGDASGLSMSLDEVPENGAVVELRLDGAVVGAFPVRPAATAVPLALPVPVRRGLHLLEIESLHGGRVLPGEVRLR